MENPEVQEVHLESEPVGPWRKGTMVYQVQRPTRVHAAWFSSRGVHRVSVDTFEIDPTKFPWLCATGSTIRIVLVNETSAPVSLAAVLNVTEL